jgi:serine/threonine-protein kinase
VDGPALLPARLFRLERVHGRGGTARRRRAQLHGLARPDPARVRAAGEWPSGAGAGHVPAARAGTRFPPESVEHFTSTEPIIPLIYAGLGDYERAFAAARRQIEANRNDTLGLARAKTALAQTHAQKGERDAAIALLPELLEMPAGITPAQLALDPLWDPIRDDPRFVALTQRPLAV